jgi:transposase, IS5 family
MRGDFRNKGVYLHGGPTMRSVYPEQRLDTLPISEVQLNLDCRDELIPILRALQHLYADDQLRHELLDLVGNDVNEGTSRRFGRRGLNYWEIIVLAAARLGCNLDYDKLQDLAENHRALRQIMGIGSWDEAVDFDWRRIEDNVNKLRPETLKKINDVIVRAGHAEEPEAIASVRGDTFVVQTNIHYPTESSVIGDGLRKIVLLAMLLATEARLGGWRQGKHLLRKVRGLVRQIGRASAAKGARTKQLQPPYRKLLKQAGHIVGRARQLLNELHFVPDPAAFTLEKLTSGATVVATNKAKLLHAVILTVKVCDNARRRVLEGETVPNAEKIHSIFEPHTELIKRGKQANPIEFGHKVLVIEDASGFVVDYQVVENGVLDQDLVMPVMKKLQKKVAGRIKSASFDRGFHTPENQEELAKIVANPCIAAKGKEPGRQQHEEGTVAFRQARQNHPGVESAIGALQAGNGLKRCRDRSKRGYRRYVGLGILGRNLQTLGKLLLAQDKAGCQAAKSNRKRVAA